MQLPIQGGSLAYRGSFERCLIAVSPGVWCRFSRVTGRLYVSLAQGTELRRWHTVKTWVNLGGKLTTSAQHRLIIDSELTHGILGLQFSSVPGDEVYETEEKVQMAKNTSFSSEVDNVSQSILPLVSSSKLNSMQSLQTNPVNWHIHLIIQTLKLKII